MTQDTSQKKSKSDTFAFWISAVALLIALGLSLASWMRLCSQACAEGHSYRLFGFTFEAVGLTLLSILTVIHFLSRKFPSLIYVAGWILCGALGAEVMFIYVQKYMIGSWCPMCLSIAAAILMATLPYLFRYYKQFKLTLEHPEKGQIMFNIYRGLTGVEFFVVGFLLAFGGVGKENSLQAAENGIKEQIAFGNLSSPVHVYIFTDWACPACRSMEPKFETMIPKIMSKATVTFVDDPVHTETMNYTPYNISFMINNKKGYLALRRALTELSEETKEPTDHQVEALAAKLGHKYQQLNYADVALANKYFGSLVTNLKVEGTPTVVIVNKKTQKGKKLPGITQITEANILKAIESLSH